MKEHFFTCPYCWQTISMLLDNTMASQVYIEDCEVCCNPIEVLASFDKEELVGFEANKSQ